MAEVHGYVCSHIFENSRPVLLVAREEGDWMFLCGALHAPEEDYHLVGINHLVERDDSVREVFTLPEDHEAEREAIGAPWRISRVASG